MTLFVELALGARNKALQDPLPRHFLGNEVIEIVAFGRGVFGVTADIQVEAGTVFEKDIARSAPCHHASEKHSRHIVGAESALPVVGKRRPELGL